MKKQNGITLMTLIITIVIMLILAFIAISSVSDSDIISQTEDASSKLDNLIQTEDNLRNQLIEELKPSDNPTDPTDPIDPPISGGCTHVNKVDIAAKAATCTEDGNEKGWKCSDCGHQEGGKTISAPGHSYETTTTDATCTEAGTTTETCTRCGDTKTTTGQALGHNYTNYVSNNDATCTKNRTETGKCSRCGEKDTITIPNSALDHTSGSSSFSVYNDWYHTKTTYCGRGANCDGYKYSSKDGKYYPAIVNTVNMIRHSYDMNYYCSECKHNCTHSYQDRTYYDGYSICRACGNRFEEYDDDDDYDYDWCDHNYIGDPPTCTYGGHMTCTICGDVKEEEPLGHDLRE